MTECRLQLQVATAAGIAPEWYAALAVEFENLAIAPGGLEVGGSDGADGSQALVRQLRGGFMTKLHTQRKVAPPRGQVKQRIAQVEGCTGERGVAPGASIEPQIIYLLVRDTAHRPHEVHRYAAVHLRAPAAGGGAQSTPQPVGVNEVGDGFRGFGAAPVHPDVPVPIGVQPLDNGTEASHTRFILLHSSGKLDQSAANIGYFLVEVIVDIVRGNAQRHLLEAGENGRGRQRGAGTGLQVGGLEQRGDLFTQVTGETGVHAAATQGYHGRGKGLVVEQVFAARRTIAVAVGDQCTAVG